MKTPLQVIADFGSPTNSYIAAMQYFGEREDLTHEQYEKGIQEIIGISERPTFDSYFFARTLFRYVVQETIRAFNTGLIPDMDLVYTESIDRACAYLEEHPWATTMFNINHGLVESEDVNPETGEVQQVSKKGAKKEVTERLFRDLKSKGASRQEIIDAFVEETGMSKAGATTYFHALKKELGFAETSVAEKKSNKVESKQELAERLYQEADDKSKIRIMNLFAEKLGTSRLGAQTYYYACKKKFASVDQNKTTV